MFHKIGVRLILSFMVPVALIILLGFSSYLAASSGIITNYISSASQALNMLGKSIDTGLKSVQTTGDQYCNDENIKKYLNGLYNGDLLNKSMKANEFTNDMSSKKLTDDLIGDIYIISKNNKPLATVSGLSENLYSEFTETELGKAVLDNRFKQYWISSDSLLDEKLMKESNQYAMRQIRMVTGTNAIFMIDIDMGGVQNLINEFETENSSILRIVTNDGKEIAPAGLNSDEIVEDTVYATEEFYQTAVQSDVKSESKEVIFQGNKYLFMYTKICDDKAMLCELVPYRVIMQQADSIKYLTMIIVLISMTIAIVIGSIISAGIDKTIKRIINSLKIAAKGDLTVEFHTKRSDEFKLLIEEIQHTFINMKGLIKQVKDSGNEVSMTTEAVNKSSKQFIQSSQKISSAISEIESGINQQANDSSECLNEMENLSNKIDMVITSTKEIKKIADDTKQAVRQGTTMTGELSLRSNETAEIGNEIVIAIKNLKSKSELVGNVINVINDIANQTNLLSLNASIEAARAGDAGLGFAVVASQIRDLAEQSKNSVKHIQTIIEGIQTDTDQAVQTAQKVEGVMNMQKNSVTNTIVSYENIDKSVEKLVLYLDEISECTDNIERARRSTLSAIESMSAVLEEISASSSNVNSSANEQLTTVDSLNNSADSLDYNSNLLMEAVDRFTIE